MQCRCPACGHSTQIPADVGDFFARCDCCSTLLKPTVHADASINIQPVYAGRFRAESSRDSGIAELLCPPQVRRGVLPAGGGDGPPDATAGLAGGEGVKSISALDDLGELAALIAADDQGPRVRRQRHALLGVTVVGTLLVLALSLIAGTIAMAKATGFFPTRPAHGADSPSTNPPPQFAEPASRPSNGELFPEVPMEADRGGT